MEKKFNGYKMSHKFNASHSMTNNELNKHAHTFWISVYIDKVEDKFSEFGEYERRVREYVKKYQTKYLNNMEEFGGKVPTLENMCIVFYRDIQSIFNETSAYRLQKVELGDSPIKSVSVGNSIIAGNSELTINEDLFNLLYKRGGADRVCK